MAAQENGFGASPSSHAATVCSSPGSNQALSISAPLGEAENRGSGDEARIRPGTGNAAPQGSKNERARKRRHHPSDADPDEQSNVHVHQGG